MAQARLGVSREEHEGFFRRMLEDVDEPTAPFGLLDVRGDGSGIEEARLALDDDLARRLRAHARRLGVSAASLCHLAWAQVLSKVTGRQEVVFGTVLFGRMQGGEGADRVMGLFINTLPIRIAMAKRARKSACGKRMHCCGDLMRHEHASLALAQRCSAVPAPAPLFSALLNYRHISGADKARSQEAMQAWQGVQWLRGEERTNYPFTLSINDLGDGFSLDAQTPASIGAMRVCEFMNTALESLAEALETSPAKAVRMIEVLPATERHRVLYEWNETKADYPSDKCVHQLIEAQAEKSPDAVAVVFEDQQLSYVELNVKANQLAHYLRELGVKPDDRVAICVERGFEMIVALMAVLKAGGAYVPLDPAYPVERLRFMIKDSAPVALLTQGHLRELFTGLPGRLPVLDLTDTAAWQEKPDTNPDPSSIGLTPSHLAYVIYTSGSTGMPKGVMVQHKNLANLVHWHWSAFALRHCQRSSSVAGFGFDAATWEIWPILCVGGTLLLPSLLDASDSEAMLAWWGKQDLDVSFLPTPMAEFAFSRGIANRHSRIILVGGDRLLRLPDKESPFSLVNNYGPTEATVVATSGRLDGSEDVIHIGRPIANTRIYILDAHGEPVPVGVTGELYIGGAGVARGYLNRAELTAERFLRDPFVNEPGARIYRTGDLGRWLSDGNIEFLGRNDFQVKIRGFRIELGEIESRLMEHRAVREAVVIAREDTSGDKRLVAYYTSGEAEDTLSVEQLRTHLSSVLPEYMVPAAYVRLELLPLTPNGKLDRNALPVPDTDAYSTRGYEAPQGEIETKLAVIWAEVLKLERVGRNDNFFSLGGHSLLAVTLVTRLRQEFGGEVAIRDLFAHATIADLAHSLVAGRTHEPPHRILSLEREAILDPTIQVKQTFQFQSSPEKIFLTGASGFLGSHLICDLITNTNATIYCLIRCANADDGKNRIVENMKQYCIFDEEFITRLVAVPGDLSMPLMGLTVSQFRVLADSIDVIYHNGAQVNGVYPYDALKAVNVLGTQEVVRLASRAKVKPVHFISTISVFPDVFVKSQDKIPTEETLLGKWQLLDSGYAQSKWVAEKLIEEGGSRGVPFAIYRPSFISGSTRIGASNPTDRLSLFIDACFDLGCVPDVDIEINMVPVDYVSRCIIAASLRRNVFKQRLNIMHTRSTNFRTICDCMLSMGIASLERESYSSWLERCSLDQSTARLATLLQSSSSERDLEDPESSHGLSARIETLIDIYLPDGILCPEITETLIQRYILWRYRKRADRRR